MSPDLYKLCYQVNKASFNCTSYVNSLGAVISLFFFVVCLNVFLNRKKLHQYVL